MQWNDCQYQDADEDATDLSGIQSEGHGYDVTGSAGAQWDIGEDMTAWHAKEDHSINRKNIRHGMEKAK